MSLTRKSKRDYYSNVDDRNVTDNKLFWKTVKPSFSDKGPMRQKITLTENDEVIGNIKEISEIFFWGVINQSIKSLRLPSTFFAYCKTQGLWF